MQKSAAAADIVDLVDRLSLKRIVKPRFCFKNQIYCMYGLLVFVIRNKTAYIFNHIFHLLFIQVYHRI